MHPIDFQLILDWPYDDALDAMRAARERVRDGGAMTLFVGSHREHVVTLGRHAPEDQLLAHRDVLAARGVLVRRVERGGGATAHEPGQLVVYPVLSLARVGLTVRSLTDALERALVDVLAAHGVTAAGDPVRRGVYVEGAKVGSLGFRVEDGVVTHGASLNVDNDLALFDLIAPCGMRGLSTTSLRRLAAAQGAGSAGLDLEQEAMRLARKVADACMLAFPS